MFIKEYLVDLNGTQAAIRAGYTPKGAGQIADENLNKPHIFAQIQKELDARAARVEVKADDVLKEIKKLAFSDVRHLFDERGRLLPVHMLPPEIAASVASVEVVSSRVPGADPVEVQHTAKIRFWDKRASLELLGKHLKLFTERHEHTVEVTTPKTLNDFYASPDAESDTP